MPPSTFEFECPLVENMFSTSATVSRPDAGYNAQNSLRFVLESLGEGDRETLKMYVRIADVINTRCFYAAAAFCCYAPTESDRLLETNGVVVVVIGK